jgi:hypothetical protein
MHRVQPKVLVIVDNDSAGLVLLDRLQRIAVASYLLLSPARLPFHHFGA